MNEIKVRIRTSYGDIVAELESSRVPATVANFLRYVDEGFYANTLIHRVVDNFIIQGGGFEPGMIQKTTRAPIKNESNSGLSNKRGTIAMGRLPNDPNSATSQFFINTRDNDVLDYNSDQDQLGYCVFGRVNEGMEVVDRIEGVGTGSFEEHSNVPLHEVLIKTIERIEEE